MQGNFSYYNPTKLYFGDESLNFLKDELKNFGAVALLIPVSFCSLMLPIKLMADKNSKYAWPPKECEKFHVMDKL